MSNSFAKAYRSKVKDARQSPAPDQPVGKKKKPKKDLPYTVEFRITKDDFFFRAIFGTKKEWRVWGRYRTLDIARQTMSQLARKHSLYEFRIPGEDAPPP